jgi:signal transduction histidine kinase
VLTSPVLARGTSGPVVGILAVGQSRQEISDTMEELRVILIGMGLVAIVLSGVIGFAAAHQGLQPLRNFARQAAALAGRRDFGTPLKVAPGGDEVANLGKTINQLLATVDETLRTHREFLADTSHELRNPLLALRTNIELMSRIPDEEGRAECQRESLEQVERLSRLVSELLTLAQIEIGLVIEESPVNLVRLIERVAGDYQKVAPERSIITVINDELTVLGDEHRLTQVLSNLVDNAIKYTDTDGKIVISLQREGNSAVVAVRDTGEGISPTHLPLIFNRFYRVHKAGPRAAQGTGLGLSIVKHLVEAHGGSVEVTSTPDIGSTFRVILPLPEQSAIAPAWQPVAAQQSLPMSEKAGSRAR